MARHTRMTRTIVAVATALGMGVVASAVPAGAADSAGTAKGKPIILMQIHEKTAGLATKDLSQGAKAGIKQVNDAGGVNGRPLQLLECDTKDDPNTAADCARTAVDKGAAAVVGALTVHPEYYPILEQNKIASFGNIPANAGDFTSSASFPIIGGAPIAFSLLALGLAKGGAQKISVARPDLAAGAVIKAFANQGITGKGLSVVNDVPVPQGAPDMSAYVQAALANGTDGVLVALSGQDALNFVQALKQADPKVKVAMASTDFGATVKALGKQADGIYNFSYSYLPVIKNAATKKFIAAAKAAKIPSTGLNTVDEYSAVLAFAAIAKQLPEVTSSALYDKLPTVSDLDIGMTAPIQFVKGGVAGIPRDFNPCGLLYQLKNGQPTPTTGKFLNPLTDQECAA